MILPDHEIQRRLNNEELVIEPLPDPDIQIQPASIDLRLGDEFLKARERRGVSTRAFDVCKGDTPDFYKTENRKNLIVMNPGDFCLGTTMERVEIPDNLMATVHGRSSVGRLGITVHVTAGIIDPGFEGEITLELANLGYSRIVLRPEMRIAQLILTQLTSRVDRPYGERGKYQGQDGAQASKIDEDTENTD